MENSTKKFKSNAVTLKLFFKDVQEGDLEIIMRYLENLDKPNAVNTYCQNALTYAALIKDDDRALEVMRCLIDIFKIDPHKGDNVRQTAIFYTVRNNLLKTTEFLITEHAVRIDDIDLLGQTPVFYAAREGHLQMIKLLIRNNANIDIIDKYGHSCLHYAIKENRLEVIKYLVTVMNLRTLKQVDKQGRTPYTTAKFNKNGSEIIDILISAGVREEKPTKKKEKIIHDEDEKYYFLINTKTKKPLSRSEVEKRFPNFNELLEKEKIKLF